MRWLTIAGLLTLHLAASACSYHSFSGLTPGKENQATVENLFRGVYDQTDDQLKQIKETVSDLAGEAAANPANVAIQNDYAYALYITGKTPQAIAVYQANIKQNNAPYEALCSYAVVLQTANRLGEAAAALKQAIALKPGFRNHAEEFHLDLVNYQILSRQNFAAARQQIIIPALTPLWARRSANPETGFASMDFPPNITSKGLTEVIRQFPENGDLWLALGMVLEHEANHEYALKSYDKAVRHGNTHMSDLKKYLRTYRPFAEQQDKVAIGGRRILQLIGGAIALGILYYLVKLLQSIVLDLTQARKAKKVLGPLGERKLESKPGEKRKHLR